jgi:hypothetical protein
MTRTTFAGYAGAAACPKTFAGKSAAQMQAAIA